MTTIHISVKVRRFLAAFVAAAGATVFLACGAQPASGPATGPGAHRADWLYRARWGLMYHVNGTRKPGKWDAAVSGFDVKTMGAQLAEVGAGYLMFASIQGDYPVAPNAVYEKRFPGECPKRDLIMDIANELGPRNIPLMLYYNSNIKWEPTDEGVAFRAAVLREYSLRYGRRVKGWWFDNSRADLPPAKIAAYHRQMADAARAGHPDAILGFSPPHGAQRNSEFDDYTAGNLHNLAKVSCPGRFVDGAQWHTLCYLGTTWGSTRPRYKGDEAADITRRLTAAGGVVTWDCPHELNGEIVKSAIPQLKAIAAAVRALPRP